MPSFLSRIVRTLTLISLGSCSNHEITVIALGLQNYHETSIVIWKNGGRRFSSLCYVPITKLKKLRMDYKIITKHRLFWGKLRPLISPFFGCVLYIGPAVFSPFFGQLWGCVLYTSAYYTRDLTVTIIKELDNN